MTPTTDHTLEFKLARYATGAVTPGMQLLIATHLETHAENAAKVEAYEVLGAAMFEAESEVAMRSDALDSIMAKLDGPSDAGAAEDVDSGPLPRSLMRALGADYGELKWQARLPGLAECVFDGFGDEQVSLLRARPGAWLPKHTHEGEETTLILTGAMEDGGQRHGPGDIILHDETTDHKPRIVGEEVCHCLVVMTGRMRFTGTFSRALNYLGE